MVMDSPSIVTPVTESLLRGALEVEDTAVGVRPHRLPAWARAQADDQLRMAESQPSGVRLALTTAATIIEVEATGVRFRFLGLAERPPGRFDLMIDGVLAGQASLPTVTYVTVNPATGQAETEPGGVATIRFDGLPAGEKAIEIWLPHNETVDLVALRTDAPVAPTPVAGRPVWLHHGSSISQGSNAEHPTGIWPAVAAGAAGLELVNLGYGGSALLDQFTARTVRDTPADLISLELGINLVNADLMRLRGFTSAVHGFLDTIRDGHADTPLLVVSPILCPTHEDTPGPGGFDPSAFAAGLLRFRATGDPAEVAAGKLTLTVIRDHLARIVAERAVADPNLHYLDGLRLYGPSDAVEHPLPDALHPDGATHQIMGERFAAFAFDEGPLAAAGLGPAPVR